MPSFCLILGEDGEAFVDKSTGQRPDGGGGGGWCWKKMVRRRHPCGHAALSARTSPPPPRTASRGSAMGISVGGGLIERKGVDRKTVPN